MLSLCSLFSVYVAVKDAEGLKISTCLSIEHSASFGSLSFCKSNARTVREALGLQLKLDDCKYEVIIDTNVGTGKNLVFTVLMLDIKL